MATRYIGRSLLTFTKQTRATAVSGSSTVVPNSKSFLFRLRPLLTASCLQRVASVFPTRNLSTRPATTSLNDPNPKFSNRPSEATLPGMDFEHWLIVVEKPEDEATREQIIDGYIKTLASVVGSEQEAKMKIYNVSTRYYFAFGVLGNEELSNKLKDLPNVRWVIPDSYVDERKKDYGGEPFINGEAVPYDYPCDPPRSSHNSLRKDRDRNYQRGRVGNAGGQYGNMGVPPHNADAVPQGPNGMRGSPNNNPSVYRCPKCGGRPYQPGPGPNPNYNPNAGLGFGPNMESVQG